MYEGYGPNGVAVLIECLTDNRNRAASDVRVAMTRNGGSMADPGSVSYLFNRKGVVIVPKGELTEDDVLGAVLDAGAEEVNDLGETFEVVSEATDMVAVRTALQEASIDYDSAEASFLPTMQVELDEEGRARSSSSSTRWRTATTCRTSSPTSTCPTRSWRRSTPDGTTGRSSCDGRRGTPRRPVVLWLRRIVGASR